MLTEKMMEEAIINDPEKYIEGGLRLLSRQFRIGSYIFDLLFEDRHGAKLIVEIQKGTLDRDHTYKIMDYYDEYKSQNPKEFVELMIIANKIPRERRDRLTSYGIPFREISEIEFDHQTEELRKNGSKEYKTEPTRNTTQLSQSEDMPKKGDVFKGKVNDLCLWDASGWRRRDIWFFKQEMNGGKRFRCPTESDRIVLIDIDDNRYELNFSKPDFDDKVCLGTPGRLKPWYQKKGFYFKTVNPDDVIYFEYTGTSNEFLVFTKDEFNIRLRNAD